MAGEENSKDVLERVFFWTMIGAVGFVGSGFVIALILAANP